MQSDLATFGGWCFLAGVFLMVSGDGLTNFSEPSPAHAWPWLYLIPLAVSLPLMVVAGRVGLRRPARAAILYRPLSALLAALALSTIFSPARALSLKALVAGRDRCFCVCHAGLETSGCGEPGSSGAWHAAAGLK